MSGTGVLQHHYMSNRNSFQDLSEYKPSGLIQSDTGPGQFLKHSEPPEKAIPSLRWRLHIFKATSQLEIIPIYEKSCYLIGRERRLADIALDHPSCSLQHAVIQFCRVQADPSKSPSCTSKPYIMDLESSNGVRINQSLIPPARYVELAPHDVIQFGFSSREYVLLYEEMISNK